MMGAGKTTVGRHLARRMGRSFVDTDHEIEARTGVKIPLIFEIEGEQGFRKRESQLIEELAVCGGMVLATGGGAILDPTNRALMARSGTVIYLSVAPELLWERTLGDKNRPLLQVADPRARIAEIYAQRDPLYREAADVIVTGGRNGPAVVLRQIEVALKDRCEV